MCAAIAGTQNRSVAPFSAYIWPPYLYVQDVSTLSTPFEGALWIDFPGCSFDYNDTQCRELGAGSTFNQQWIASRFNPQAWYHNGRGGTDWTEIGAYQDGLVEGWSALELHQIGVAGHKVMYYYSVPELASTTSAPTGTTSPTPRSQRSR